MAPPTTNVHNKADIHVGEQNTRYPSFTNIIETQMSGRTQRTLVSKMLDITANYLAFQEIQIKSGVYFSSSFLH